MIELEAGAIELVHDESKPEMPSPDRMPVPRRSGARQVDVSRYGDLYEVRISIGTVQPGTTAWCKEAFHIGARQTTTAVAKVTTADNLRVPVSFTADIFIEATSRKVAVKDITRGFGG